MSDYRKLIAYQKAFKIAMAIFDLTKSFPKEEIYALSNQNRRSSRSVCANLAEGYRKRSYPKHFVSKLTDADMENSETIVWLEFCLHCGYISKDTFEELTSNSEEAGKLIHYMINYPQKFI